MKERKKVTVSSVRRSHFEEVGERYKEWQTADLRNAGSLGRNRRAAARGPSWSIKICAGCNERFKHLLGFAWEVIRYISRTLFALCAS